MWTLAFGDHEDRMPRHGYAATRVCDEGVCQELASGLNKRHRALVTHMHLEGSRDPAPQGSRVGFSFETCHARRVLLCRSLRPFRTGRRVPGAPPLAKTGRGSVYASDFRRQHSAKNREDRYDRRRR
jgi:hypothetical protein